VEDRLMNRLPVTTFAVLAASVFATWSPAAADALIYDRQAIAAGEVWRLLTGHLVHLSARHLASDLLAFGIGGVLIERSWGRSSGALYLAMSAGIGLSLWALDPALARFGGLSGLAYGNMAFLVLTMHARRQAGHGIAQMLLAAMLIKLLMDFTFTTSGLLGSSAGQAVTVPLSHLMGVLIACISFVVATQENRHVTV
jgi:rhomboid family GlyGly-CTERM serine protease